jgi:hypothetical protein
MDKPTGKARLAGGTSMSNAKGHGVVATEDDLLGYAALCQITWFPADDRIDKQEVY